MKVGDLVVTKDDFEIYLTKNSIERLHRNSIGLIISKSRVDLIDCFDVLFACDIFPIHRDNIVVIRQAIESEI